MRVAAVGLTALGLVEMRVAVVGGGAELGIRQRVVSGIGAVMLLLGERMRACCCFNPAKGRMLGQILVVLVLNQLPQGFSTRRWGLLVMVVVSFYKAS